MQFSGRLVEDVFHSLILLAVIEPRALLLTSRQRESKNRIKKEARTAGAAMRQPPCQVCALILKTPN